MKYELEIEPARLEYKQADNPKANIHRKPAKLNLHSKNTSVKIDTYEARKSLNIKKIDDRIEEFAAKGKEHINKITREYVEIGKQMGQIQNGTTIKDIYRNKMLEEPSLVTTFLPNGGADLTWDPAELQVEYEDGELETEWQIDKNKMNYVPGSVRMKIIEFSSVDIEYLGGPMYVPPSASPDYEETK